MAKRIGTNKRDILTGTSGDDLINGRDGDDDLDGLGGIDTMNGGLGSDLLSGRGGNDILNGDDGNDFLFGDAGTDQLFGGAGRDFLVAGNDVATDILNGGTGIDTVSYSKATGAVTAYLAAQASGGAAVNDRYFDVENVIGGAFDDVLECSNNGFAYGGNGIDFLFGGAADGSIDPGGTLRGDAGQDQLFMNLGATRAWLQRDIGPDLVHNFIEGQDRFFIDLSEFGLGRSLTAKEVRNGDELNPIGRHAQFIFNSASDTLFFDPDGSGFRAAQAIAGFISANLLGDDLDFQDFGFML